MKNPYIEYKEKRYEFEADFLLKREFDRERQNETKKALIKSGVSEKDYEEFKKLQDFVNENKEKGINCLSDSQKEVLLRMFDLMDLINLNKVYEKYCYKMLNKKYKLSENEFYSLLEGLANDYGIEFVDELIQKVCEKVFTQLVENTQKKPLPTWDWMN